MIYQRIINLVPKESIYLRKGAETLIKEKKLEVNLPVIVMKVNTKLNCINVNLNKINYQTFSSKLLMINKLKYLVKSSVVFINLKTILYLPPQQYKKDLENL